MKICIYIYVYNILIIGYQQIHETLGLQLAQKHCGIELPEIAGIEPSNMAIDYNMIIAYKLCAAQGTAQLVMMGPACLGTAGHSWAQPLSAFVMRKPSWCFEQCWKSWFS